MLIKLKVSEIKFTSSLRKIQYYFLFLKSKTARQLTNSVSTNEKKRKKSNIGFKG